jgi:hypothetical protein
MQQWQKTTTMPMRRGNLVLGAALLSGAARKVVCAPPHAVGEPRQASQEA